MVSQAAVDQIVEVLLDHLVRSDAAAIVKDLRARVTHGNESFKETMSAVSSKLTEDDEP